MKPRAVFKRLFAIQQRIDESAARYEARVLNLAIKNFLFLSFNDEQQASLNHLLIVLEDSKLQKEVRLRL